MEPAEQPPAMRVSDADREAAVTELREHGTAGRLDVEELEQRIGAAYAARTNADLTDVTQDLPRRPRVVATPGRARHDQDWRAFFAVNVLLVAIWAASGAGYFWPGWVMVWWAFALAMKGAPGLLRLR